MSTDVTKMAQDVQDRIRDLAYMMWESAGRQQGLAMQYWLSAEKEVLGVMQAAAASVGVKKATKAAAAEQPAREPAAKKSST